ncbi:MAG: SRPBCC family protein [Alphaproteobacteria bacterium]
MNEVNYGEDIALSAEAVWAVIGDFSGIRKWAGAVEAESTEVTPKGKVRTLTMPGGRSIQELMTDEGPHHYTYTLDRPDMDAYFSTVSVVPGASDACRIELTVKFTPKDPSALEATTEQLTKFCRGNVKAMKRALGLA